MQRMSFGRLIWTGYGNLGSLPQFVGFEGRVVDAVEPVEPVDVMIDPDEAMEIVPINKEVEVDPGPLYVNTRTICSIKDSPSCQSNDYCYFNQFRYELINP